MTREDIETFVHLGDQYSFYEAAKQSGTVGRDYPKPPKTIEKHARLIDDKLAEITICDPAVGSGAFPVGMMTEIVRARSALTPYFNDVHERTPYQFKRHTIQNCLYGVDIDDGAVEIAKLRLWLSLVVDEEEVKQIKPLPNLDYKIVTGNSLLSVEKNLFNEKLFRDLEELKPRYFNEAQKDKKDAYKKKIDILIHELTNGKEIFDFGIFFSEVFHNKDGFDVVIGNPPYVAGKSGSFSESEKAYFNQNYEVAEYQLDTYVLFAEKGTTISRNGGILTYIIPNTWLANIKLVKIRKYLLDQTSIRNIVINPNDVFTASVVDTIILITQKIKSKNSLISIGTFKHWRYVEKNKVDQAIFYSNNKLIFDIQLDQSNRLTIDKIGKKSVLIKDICDVNRGVHAYRKDGFGRTKFGKGHQTERDYNERSYHSKGKLDSTYYREVRGKNVFPYYFVASNEFISWGDWLAEPRGWKYFSGERIYLRKIVGKTLFAALVDSENVADQSIYIAKVKDKTYETKYVLALLNSRLLTWYFRVKANEFDDLFPQIKVTEFKELPIRKANPQKPFIIIVDKILGAKRGNPEADTTAWEREIDRLVYELYDLAKEEIAIIEGSQGERSSAKQTD